MEVMLRRGNDEQPRSQFQCWLADVAALEAQLQGRAASKNTLPEFAIALEAVSRARRDLARLVEREREDIGAVGSETHAQRVAQGMER